MRGDPDGPPAVWDLGHVGYREGTSQEICCSGFETQGGFTLNYSMRIRSLIPTGDTL